MRGSLSEKLDALFGQTTSKQTRFDTRVRRERGRRLPFVKRQLAAAVHFILPLNKLLLNNGSLIAVARHASAAQHFLDPSGWRRERFYPKRQFGCPTTSLEHVRLAAILAGYAPRSSKLVFT